MSFSVGIIGLPNAGKSTLFKALTKNQVEIASYPFTTLKPNYGKVFVPDQRLKKIAEIIKPEKITFTTIEFVDIAGLVKGAYKGEGLGNQFLAQIRNCDALLEVARAFEDEKVEHFQGRIDPKRDIEIIKVELLMKDLENLENLLKKLEKDKKRDKIFQKKFEFLKKIKEKVAEGKLISQLDLTKEEKAQIKEYQFLTSKPIFYILNVNKENQSLDLKIPHLILNLKLEEEISELSPSEIKELKIKTQLDKIILSCYNILNLITFYTVAGKKEARAWTIKKGTKVPQAARVVHSDFEEKFIRAEVINWQKLIKAKSWQKARELGWLKIVGKDYIVEDGDVIEFRI
jgi:GTP-binding protein YchF